VIYFKLTFFLNLFFISFISYAEVGGDRAPVCTKTLYKNGEQVEVLTEDFVKKSMKTLEFVECEVSRKGCRKSTNAQLAIALSKELERDKENIQEKTEELAAGEDLASIGADPGDELEKKEITGTVKNTARESAQETASRILGVRSQSEIAAITLGNKVLTDVLAGSAEQMGKKTISESGIINKAIERAVKPGFNASKNYIINRPYLARILSSAGVGLGAFAGGFSIPAVVTGAAAMGAVYYIGSKTTKIVRTKACYKKCTEANSLGCVSAFIRYGKVYEGNKAKSKCMALPQFTNRHFQFFARDEKEQLRFLKDNPELCSNIHQIYKGFTSQYEKNKEQVSVTSCEPSLIKLNLTGDLKDVFGQRMEYEGRYKYSSPSMAADESINEYNAKVRRRKRNFKPITKKAVFPTTARYSRGVNINTIKFNDYSKDAKPKFCSFYGKVNCQQTSVSPLKAPEVFNGNTSDIGVDRKKPNMSALEINPIRKFTPEECSDSRMCSKKHKNTFSQSRLKTLFEDEESKPKKIDIYAQRVAAAESSMTMLRNDISVCCNQLLEKGSRSIFVRSNCGGLGPAFNFAGGTGGEARSKATDGVN